MNARLWPAHNELRKPFPMQLFLPPAKQLRSRPIGGQNLFQLIEQKNSARHTVRQDFKVGKAFQMCDLAAPGSQKLPAGVGIGSAVRCEQNGQRCLVLLSEADLDIANLGIAAQASQQVLRRISKTAGQQRSTNVLPTMAGSPVVSRSAGLHSRMIPDSRSAAKYMSEAAS